MSLFTKIAIVVNDPSLITVPFSDIEPLGEFESAAYDHWIFDQAGAAGLTGVVSGRALTLQGVAPVYASKHLTLPFANGAALLTDLEETANISDTMAFVFKASSVSSLQILSGTYAGTQGGSPFISSGSLYQNYRYALASTETGDTIAADQWYFLAVSRDFSGATNAVRMLLGGGSAVEMTGVGDYAPASPGEKIALGNAYYTSVSAATCDFAEVMVFDNALSGADLLTLYSRSKARMAKRGITIT